MFSLEARVHVLFVDAAVSLVVRFAFLAYRAGNGETGKK